MELLEFARVAIALLALVFAVLGFVVASGRLWAAIYPIYRQRRDRRLLEENLLAGQFDRETINSSTRFYIEPYCTNLDPSQEEEIRHALVATKGAVLRQAGRLSSP